jgi:hypothetical protein
VHLLYLTYGMLLIHIRQPSSFFLCLWLQVFWQANPLSKVFPNDSNKSTNKMQRSNGKKPEAPSAVARSWCWAERRPKHVGPHINVKQQTCETVASCWLIYLNHMMMNGLANFKCSQMSKNNRQFSKLWTWTGQKTQPMKQKKRNRYAGQHPT